MLSRNLLLLLVLSTICSSLVVVVVEAGPNGALGCTTGRAAVGGLHRVGDVVRTGSLADGGITLRINEEEVDPGLPLVLPMGVDHTWSLSVDPTQEGVRPFRGFLLRLEQQAEMDLSETIQVDDETLGQVADICLPTTGSATHRNNDEKELVQGSLIFDEPGIGFWLDITIVVENRMVNGTQRSAFFYSGLEMRVESTETESSAATDMPTGSGSGSETTVMPSMASSLVDTLPGTVAGTAPPTDGATEGTAAPTEATVVAEEAARVEEAPMMGFDAYTTTP